MKAEVVKHGNVRVKIYPRQLFHQGKEYLQCEVRWKDFDGAWQRAYDPTLVKARSFAKDKAGALARIDGGRTSR